MIKTTLLLTLFVLTINFGLSQSHRDSVNIHNYNLQLDLTRTHNGYIIGTANIKLTTLHNTNTITLDLYKLNTDSVFVNSEKKSFTTTDTSITIKIGDFTKNDTSSITVFYQGYPKKDSHWGGFYYTEDYAYHMGVGMASYPHGIGRYIYPCIDSFSERATYQFSLKTDKGKWASANGILKNHTSDSLYEYFNWQLNETIPTYLSWFACGPYIKISDTYSGIEAEIPIELFVSKGDSLNTINTFSDLKATLATFEKCFGPYCWSKVGYTAVPFPSGAMEHATNIAFPINSLNSSMSSKNLAAHELAHSWFGNLATCNTSSDMWLNEGWASYCETIFKENVYNYETGLQHTLKNQESVMRSAHISDNGYFALNDISPDITYGSTVYNKGALVVHCLRGYLGDSVFFKGVSEFLNQNKYTSISSDYMQQELSEITGVDLSNFFNNWVFQPGFPHYQIDFYTTEVLDNKYQVQLNMQQKLKARDSFSQQNRVPVSIYNDQWQSYDTTIAFNKQQEGVVIEVPFKPTAIFTDLNHNVLDASTSAHTIISETGYHTFEYCDFKLRTNKIIDSVLINVSLNWVMPDNFTKEIDGIKLSNYFYWKVEGMFPETFNADGKFSIIKSKNNNPEATYSINETDSLVLLYRTNISKNWSPVQKGAKANTPIADIWCKNLKPGFYAIGIWDGETPITLGENQNKSTKPIIYPIPTTRYCTINLQDSFTGIIELVSNTGKIIESFSQKNITSFSFSTKQINSGLFFIRYTGNINGILKAIKVDYD